MRRWLLLPLLALQLAACSGLRLVESQVVAVVTTPADQPIEAGARYRFERLPLQDADTAEVEAIAMEALAKVGLLRDDSDARYSVQLSSRMQSYLADDWGHPYDGARVGGSIMIGTGSMGSMVGLGMRFPPPTRYRHEVSLLLRDLRGNQLVYETRATHEGPWNDRLTLLPALLAAALQDFPQPPPGPRRVQIELEP